MINLIDTSAKFRQNISKMLKTKLRIDEQIKILVNIMSVSQSKCKKMNENNKMPLAVELMNEMIQNQTNIIKILKLIILIQRCIIEQNTMGYGRIIQKLIKKCQHHGKLTNLICKELDTKTSEHLIKNLLSPLLFYLQRRLKIQESQKLSHKAPSILTQRNLQNINSQQNNLKSKSITQIKVHKQVKQKYSEMNNQLWVQVQGCYLLINLLSKFSVMAGPLQTIIRYYGGCYGCFQDLNITIAMDRHKIYGKLYKKVQKITEIISFNVNLLCQLSPIQNNNVLQREHENLRVIQVFKQLLKQIQKVKESVQNIFRNSYYSMSLKPYIPNFIHVEVLQEKLSGMEIKIMESKISNKKENYLTEFINNCQGCKLISSGGFNQQNILRNSIQNEEINNQQQNAENKQNFCDLSQMSVGKMVKLKDSEEQFERTMSSSTYSIRIIEKGGFQNAEKKEKYDQNLSTLWSLQEVIKCMNMIEEQRNKKQIICSMVELKLDQIHF